MLALHRTLIAGLLLLATTPLSAGPDPEFRGMKVYGFYADPAEDKLEADEGWGFGTAGAWNLPGTPSWVEFGVGLEGGALESDVGPAIPLSTDLAFVIADTHDYFGLYGSAKAIGRQSVVRPHFGVNLILARQDLKILSFDPVFGEFEQIDSDEDTGLAYDVNAGVLFKLGRSSGIDLGVRYLWLDEVSITTDTQRGGANSEFWLYSLGFVFQLP